MVMSIGSGCNHQCVPLSLPPPTTSGGLSPIATRSANRGEEFRSNRSIISSRARPAVDRKTGRKGGSLVCNELERGRRGCWSESFFFSFSFRSGSIRSTSSKAVAIEWDIVECDYILIARDRMAQPPVPPFLLPPWSKAHFLTFWPQAAGRGRFLLTLQGGFKAIIM